MAYYSCCFSLSGFPPKKFYIISYWNGFLFDRPVRRCRWNNLEALFESLIDWHLPTYEHIYLPIYLPTYLPTYQHILLPTYRHIYLPTSTPSSNNQKQTGINLVKHFENPKKVPMTILGRCHFWICFTPFLTITHKVSIAFNLRSLAHWLSRGLPCCGDSWLWVWILVPFTRSMDIFHIIFCKHESAVWPLKTKGWWMMVHVPKSRFTQPLLSNESCFTTAP